MDLKETKKQFSDDLGKGRKWIRKINDAIIRLNFKQRANDIKTLEPLLDGAGLSIRKTNFVDLNDGLPLFEESVQAVLPDIPDASVDVNFDDEMTCPTCEGTLSDENGDICPTCLGKGTIKENLDRKLEAYVDVMFKPHIGNVKNAATDSLWDDSRWGIGWIKTVWNRVEKKANISRDGADYEEQVARAAAEVEKIMPLESDNHIIHIEKHSVDIEELTAQGADPEIIDIIQQHIDDYHKPELENRVTQFPLAIHVPVNQLVYDPFAERPQDITWKAEFSIERIKTLKDVKNIKNITRENITPALVFNQAIREESDTDDLPFEDQFVYVWKIHDITNNQWIWVPADESSIDNGNDFDENHSVILDVDFPYPCDIYVPVITRGTGRPQVHGLSTLLAAKTVLLELAKVNSYIQRHAERHSTYKRIFPRGQVDDKDKAQLKNPDQYIIEMSPSAVANSQEFRPPPIPETLLQYRGILLSSLRQIIGTSNQATGADDPHTISATDASLRAGYYDSKVSRKQEAMSDALALVAMNFISMFKEFAVKGVPVIFDTENGKDRSMLLPSDIPDGFRILFDVSSTTEQAKSAKIQALQNVIQLGIQTGVVNPRKGIALLGRNLGIRRPESLFVDVPLPQEGDDRALGAIQGDDVPEDNGQNKAFSMPGVGSN